MRAVVACFGNVLRADDGVGPYVAQQLSAQTLPPGVDVLEVGIGGIHLVQELLGAPADLLLVVDALDLQRPAGSVIVQRPDVADLSGLSVHEQRDQLADMHLATPEKALMVCRALGVLPRSTFVVGVQTTDTQEPRYGLSDTTAAAVPVVIEQVHRLLAEHAVDGTATRPAGA